MHINEMTVVNDFSNILGLKNQTDGTLFIYQKNKDEPQSTKPDGYYFKDGVTFILDAKASNQKFKGQLEDYMYLEKNPYFVGFKYSNKKFECYINGKLVEIETKIQKADYYIDKYFPIRETNVNMVEQSAKKLANMFRDSGMNKQMNVPFIGAVMLCIKYDKEIINNTTSGILRLIKEGISEVISDTPLARKEKKEFLKQTLDDATLKRCEFHELLNIMNEISTVYNFVNVSNKKGHDTMNSFLRIFRKWNSADSQEKGQVFTPDHIAQLMYKIINCNKNDVILDPTCGSGTFLTNAMANMLEETDDHQEQMQIMENNIFGIENDDFNATLAGINMLLHGDGASNIYRDDCFDRLPKLKNQFNKILMNPPFSQKIPELKFVLESLNNCKENGMCAAILPLACAIGNKYKEERKILLQKHSLIKVITLPTDLFQPNAGVATCIMVFKAHVKHDGKIEQYDFTDDGYIIAKHVGRINKDHDKKIKLFYEQVPVIKNVTYQDNWLLEKEIDYSKITKLDFIKAKLDFMLINKDIKQKIIDGSYSGDEEVDI